MAARDLLATQTLGRLYWLRMFRRAVFSVAIFLSIAAVAQEKNPSASLSEVRPGELSPKVACAAQPEQSYALYLPANYTSAKTWPIVYAFDPAARGDLPVELMKDAAEHFGYIVVGSNNSRNGPSQAEAEAAQAMFADTHTRFAIDNHRVYLAGFSGGARLAASLAQRCRCAAGVFLNGAGFSVSSPPVAENKFAVFSAVGTLDFNYPEVVSLDAKLASLQYPHHLRRFEGPHQWAPSNAADEALAWFRLISMKEGREPRDASFIEAQAAQELRRARDLETSSDAYAAWQEYRQAAATFDNLGETQAFRERAIAMESEKHVRDGAKREQQDFATQARLTADISQGLFDLREDSTSRAEIRARLARQIADLRSIAQHEKNPRQSCVFHRALSDVFVQAMEAGEDRLRSKDYSHACDYFGAATNADPDSFWALSNLAVARALAGDRKGALQTLGIAKQKAQDDAAFAAWLGNEPAFSKLRETPEFRALLGSSP